MNPTDPLQQLRDIHLPEAISWWPLAPGWWLLMIIAVSAVAVLLWFVLRSWRARAYRRAARRELQQCHARWQQEGNDRAYLEAVNSILKRTALRSFPPREVAALSGERWCSYLDAQLRKPPASPLAESALARNYYSAQPPASEDLQSLQQGALYWLRYHRGRPC